MTLHKLLTERNENAGAMGVQVTLTQELSDIGDAILRTRAIQAFDHAAKCLIVMVKVGKKTTRYVLAVVPGGSRVDLAQVKKVLGGTYAAFASLNVAEELAGSVVGTVLPFAFDERLELIVDPSLFAAPELFFNAGCLDRSVALRTEDYRRVAMPRVEHIAQQSG